jgi:photosystem II stability/assembly factor-like uncharacterized protein
LPAEGGGILCVAPVFDAAACEPDGAPLDWGEVPVGEVATLELSVANRGSGILTVTSVHTTHERPDSHLFDVSLCRGDCEEQSPLPVELAPGERATLRLELDVQTDGLVPQETLVLASSDGGDRVAPIGEYRRPMAGEIAGCRRGHVDANGSIEDGCECVPVGSVEACDGEDDDCNGVVDDDATGAGIACDTGLSGVCTEGRIECTDGELVCTPTQPSTVEACDGLDNDCDGLVDEEGSWRGYAAGFSGGNMSYVGFDPRSPGVAFATAGARVYRSTDDGQGFSLAGEAPSAIAALAFPPGATHQLLAAAGGGLLRSDDDGATWSSLSLAGFGLNAVLVHPADPQRIFVAAKGVGILRSTNGGSSFHPVNQGVPLGEITSLTGDPQDPDVVVAGVILLTPQSGWSHEGLILRTDDGGASWSSALSNVGRVYRAARCPVASQTLFAAVENDGLLRSDDGGVSFAEVGLSGEDVTDVALDPADCDRLYATVWPDGVLRSTDGGQTFVGPLSNGMDVERPGDTFTAVSFDQADRALAANHKGVFVTSAAGSSWARSSAVNAALVRSLASSPAVPDTLWMATWGQGLWRREASYDWEPSSSLPADWLMTVAPDPSDAERALVGAWSRLWLTTDSGVSFDPLSGPENVLAVAYHPLDPQILYVATQVGGIWKSTNGGTSWAQKNVGMPPPWPTGACTCIDTTQVLVDPAVPSRVYAGTNGQGVFRSDDAAETWQAVGPELAGETITCLLRAPGPPAALYACVSDRGIWRSEDLGASFVAANQGLGSLNITGAVMDRQTAELFVTNDQGAFRSVDGTSWTDMDSRCIPGPAATTPALVDDGGTRLLVVGTVGGGMAALPLP